MRVKEPQPETMKFGEHLIYDAYGCPLEKLNNKRLCSEIMLEVIKLAGMRKLMRPKVIKASGNDVLGGHDPGGYSGFVIIQESHVSLHTFAKRGFVTVDLYSCKPFAVEAVIAYLNSAFKPKGSDILKLERGLKYPLKNIY